MYSTKFLIGVVIYVLFSYFTTPKAGSGHTEPAPASLSYIGELGYYALHPRVFKFFWTDLVKYVIYRGIVIFGEDRWPHVTWRTCFSAILISWLSAISRAINEADYCVNPVRRI